MAIIGRHLGAAVQNAGAGMGQAMQQAAMLSYQSQIRAGEKEEDRRWREEQAQLTRDAQLERAQLSKSGGGAQSKNIDILEDPQGKLTTALNAGFTSVPEYESVVSQFTTGERDPNMPDHIYNARVTALAGIAQKYTAGGNAKVMADAERAGAETDLLNRAEKNPGLVGSVMAAMKGEMYESRHKPGSDGAGGAEEFKVKDRVAALVNEERSLLTQIANTGTDDERAPLLTRLARIRRERDALHKTGETENSMINRLMSGLGTPPNAPPDVRAPLLPGEQPAPPRPDASQQAASDAENGILPYPRDPGRRRVGQKYRIPDGRLVEWRGDHAITVQE